MAARSAAPHMCRVQLPIHFDAYKAASDVCTLVCTQVLS